MEEFNEKGVLKNFIISQDNTCRSLFFNKVEAKACNFNKKDNLEQVFSCEFAKCLRTSFLENIFGRPFPIGCFNATLDGTSITSRKMTLAVCF